MSVSIYYTITDYPDEMIKDSNLVAICLDQQQGYALMNHLGINGKSTGLTYIVLDEVVTDQRGLVVSKVKLASRWVYDNTDIYK